MSRPLRHDAKHVWSRCSAHVGRHRRIMVLSLRSATAVAAVLLTAIAVGAQRPQTVWDAVYTKEQSDRGEKLYVEYCSRCHGDGLGGRRGGSPADRFRLRRHLGRRAARRSFERMRMSMPQDKPGSLSRAQNADILAYMLRVGEFPAGEKALDGQAGALAQITFRMVTGRDRN